MQYPEFQTPGPRQKEMNEGGQPGYFQEGFLAIQYAVDMAIAEYYTGVNPRGETRQPFRFRSVKR